jgi:hypothetical protein
MGIMEKVMISGLAGKKIYALVATIALAMLYTNLIVNL